VDPVETTLRGLASYTIPRVDVQVSATMRSQPPRIFRDEQSHDFRLASSR